MMTSACEPRWERRTGSTYRNRSSAESNVQSRESELGVVVEVEDLQQRVWPSFGIAWCVGGLSIGGMKK